jgi:hypothetical protein
VLLGEQHYWETRHVFSLSGRFVKLLASQSDRTLFEHRIANKLSGVRRGRLYLPRHFPPEVKALTKLTTSQLRNTIYAVTADDRTCYSVDSRLASFVHQAMPGGQVRTVDPDYRVHERQTRLVKPLEPSHWPRLGTRAAWPSSPTVVELLEMSRRGITPLPMQKPITDEVVWPISLAQYNSDAVLRARVISNQVVGIRSDVKVPMKYHRHFRYRWNFLILAVPYNLPIGLVRFLTGQWIRNPHNLWLREKTSFKWYLKKTEMARFACGTPGPW